MKFIICYANPAFHKDDKKPENKRILEKQLSGHETLPTQIETWKGWIMEMREGSRLKALLFSALSYSGANK